MGGCAETWRGYLNGKDDEGGWKGGRVQSMEIDDWCWSKVKKARPE